MTDWSAPTGSAGTVLIRLTGNTLQFWVSCSNGSTNTFGNPWSGVVNNTPVSGTFNFAAGAGSVLVGQWTVSTNQTASFTMGATGTSGLGGPTSVSATFSFSTVPGQVGAPSVSNVAPTAMTLSWGLPGNGGAALDQILLRRYPSLANLNADSGYTNYTLGGSTTSYRPTDLVKDTSYWWVVYAHNANGYSTRSAYTVGTTTDIPSKPGTPAIASKTSTSVSFTTVDPDANQSAITSRLLQVSRDSTFATIDATATTASPTVSGLLRNTLYYYRWRVTNGVGDSAWSDTGNVTTMVDLPSAPTGYGVTDLASTTAYLSAGAVADNGGGQIIDVRAQYNTSASATGATTVTAGAVRPVFLSGLTAGTTYYVRQAVANNGIGGGWGAYGDWVSFTTKANVPSAPSGLTSSLIADTTARLSWTTPSALNGTTITNYTVRVSADPGFGTGVLSLNPTGNLQDLTGLQPGTTYYWQVWSNTPNGVGSYSSIVSFTTTGVAPAPASVWIRLAGIWRRGTMWLKVAGVWKTVTPWIKVNGTWRKL